MIVGHPNFLHGMAWQLVSLCNLEQTTIYWRSHFWNVQHCNSSKATTMLWLRKCDRTRKISLNYRYAFCWNTWYVDSMIASTQTPLLAWIPVDCYCKCWFTFTIIVKVSHCVIITGNKTLLLEIKFPLHVVVKITGFIFHSQVWETKHSVVCAITRQAWVLVMPLSHWKYCDQLFGALIANRIS